MRYTSQINSAKFSKNHKNQEPLNLRISCFLLGQLLSNFKNKDFSIVLFLKVSPKQNN